jgi:hypothetical protein
MVGFVLAMDLSMILQAELEKVQHLSILPYHHMNLFQTPRLKLDNYEKR